MHVATIMTRHVTTVDPAVELAVASEIMRSGGFHHLVVVQAGVVLGVVSDRDLLRAHPARPVDVLRVEHVMTRGTLTATSDVPVQRVAAVMRGAGIHCLPIVDAGALVGIVTTTDLLGVIAEPVPLHALDASSS